MKPICHISHGRSGGTLAMKLLSDNPNIVTHQKYPYETFIANHITKLFKILTSKSNPSIYPKYGSPAGLIGPFPDYKISANDILFDNALKDACQDILKPMCKEFIIETYRNIAKEQEQPVPSHFIEKFGYFLVHDLKKLFDQTYLIVFVRDFRDLLSSIKEFNEKRGYKSFGAENYEKFSDYIQGGFYNRIKELHNFVKENDCLVVRYEDFVIGKKDILVKMYEFVGVDYDLSHIDNIISKSEKKLGDHRTSKTAQESIRKFESILTHNEIDICNGMLGDILQYHNYTI